MSIICAVDVETDGLGPGCRAWEVAVVRRDGGGGQTCHRWFLPLNLKHSDPFALKVGGFWDRHPMGRKVSGKPDVPGEPVTPTHDVARDVMRLTFGATLVGSNPAFDADVLGRLLRCEGYLPSWSHRLRDVATLATGHLGYDIGGLDGALEALDITWHPKESRHTAMADALAALDVYDAVMKRADE